MPGRLLLLAAFACAAAACRAPDPTQFVSMADLALPNPTADADRLFAAAQETLRQHDFRLDRVDRRAGIITTLPETSKHWFEFWRKDVIGRYGRTEATLNAVRRWVEVRIAMPEVTAESAVPQSDGQVTAGAAVPQEEAAPQEEAESNGRAAAQAQVEVIVHKERLSSPDRQFNNSGAVTQFFGDRLPSTTGLARVTVEDDHWLGLGRDPILEQHLLRDLMQRAGLVTIAAPPPPEAAEP